MEINTKEFNAVRSAIESICDRLKEKAQTDDDADFACLCARTSLNVLDGVFDREVETRLREEEMAAIERAQEKRIAELNVKILQI